MMCQLSAQICRVRIYFFSHLYNRGLLILSPDCAQNGKHTYLWAHRKLDCMASILVLTSMAQAQHMAAIVKKITQHIRLLL
jgi:hypothetical protein